MRTISILTSLIISFTLLGATEFPAPTATATEQNAHHQIVRRAAFDLGSGLMKMEVADVDTTSHQIVNVLLKTVKKVGFSQDLAEGGKDLFSPAIQDKAVATLKELKALAEPFHPESYRGIATAAFRKAKNAPDLVERLKKDTGIPISIINQDTEGSLGFLSLVADAKVDPNHSVSWDLGGGSFQIAAECDLKVDVLEGDLGIASMRNAVIKDIQHRDPAITESPNPISQEQAIQALQIVTSKMGSMPACVRDRLKDPTTQVFFLTDLPYTAQDEVYTTNEIGSLIAARLNKDDQQLAKEPDAHVTQLHSVTSLLLAYAVMTDLGIKQMKSHALPTGSTAGLLISEQYWK